MTALRKKSDSQTFFDRHIDKKLCHEENILFMKQCLKRPLQLGTCLPVSVHVADTIADLVPLNAPILEIGAGTGRITRSLLKNGIIPHDLTLVELEEKFCDYLQKTLPMVLCSAENTPTIIHGDASEVQKMIPSHLHGSIECVVSSIPLMCLSQDARLKMILACFEVMKPGSALYHVSYNPFSPLAFAKNLGQERLKTLWSNISPAFVWKYTQH